MASKKTKYDDNLRSILKSLLNSKNLLNKKFEDLPSFKDYLLIHCVDEFINTTLNVSDKAYKNELHRILKPHVKKLFGNEFKDLIKVRFELFQNKKKLEEQTDKEQKLKLERELRLVRSFLEDSSHNKKVGISRLGAELQRPFGDRVIVNVYLNAEGIGARENFDPYSYSDQIYNTIKNVLGIETYVTLKWI